MSNYRRANNAWTEDYLFLRRGCERRLPYYDRRLIEFSLQLPFWFKTKFDQNGSRMHKLFAIEAMREILPESIRQRRYKTSYNTLFFGGVRAVLDELLVGPLRMSQIGLVDERLFREYANRLQMGQRPALDQMECAIALEWWLRNVEGGLDLGQGSYSRESALFRVD